MLGSILAYLLAASVVLWMTATLAVRLVRSAMGPRGTSMAFAGLFEEPLYVPRAWVLEYEDARASYDR